MMQKKKSKKYQTGIKKKLPLYSTIHIFMTRLTDKYKKKSRLEERKNKKKRRKRLENGTLIFDGTFPGSKTLYDYLKTRNKRLVYYYTVSTDSLVCRVINHLSSISPSKQPHSRMPFCDILSFIACE